MEKIKVSIVKKGIQPFISINGDLYNALSFKTFRPTDRNISDFYKAGIRLFDILSTGTTSSVKEIKYSLYGESWIDDETYNFDVIDNQIDLFIKNAPDAYFGIMLVLDTREWWLKKRKGYPNSFTNLGQMFMDPEWNRLAGLYLKRAVEHIEDKYGDKVYSYYLLCGHTTEWFSMNFELPSKFVEDDIKNKKLDITIPDENEINKTLNRILLNDEKDSNIIKYRKYLNNAKVDCILNFAKIVKNATNNNKLVGLYFGYSTEVGHRMFVNHGNMEYERVFLSNDIDIICSPMSYQYRKLEDSPSAMITYSTINERNKLYFLEFDYSLFGSKGSTPVYGHFETTKNYDESIALLDREYVYSLQQGSAYWWFDMFEGWFYDDVIMNRIQKQISVSNYLKNETINSNSEVAVVVDIDSMYYCNKNNNMHMSTIMLQRKGLGLAGCSYDLYSSCDLNYLQKNQYKLAFFLNMFEICSEKSKQIDDLEKNKTLVYVVAPGYIKDGKFSLDNCCKRTHMNLKMQDFESQISLGNGDVINCEPSGPAENYVPVGDFALYIDDKDVVPLGYYTKSKKVAVGYKKIGDHYIVFSGLGDLPSSLLRQIYELAGVHLYSKTDDVVVFNNSKLLGLYHTKECDANIYVKDDNKFIDLLSEKEYQPINGVINIEYSGKERTKLLIKKEEINI